MPSRGVDVRDSLHCYILRATCHVLPPHGLWARVAESSRGFYTLTRVLSSLSLSRLWEGAAWCGATARPLQGYRRPLQRFGSGVPKRDFDSLKLASRRQRRLKTSKRGGLRSMLLAPSSAQPATPLQFSTRPAMQSQSSGYVHCVAFGLGKV